MQSTIPNTPQVMKKSPEITSMRDYAITASKYSVVPGDSKYEIETQRWIWASFLLCALETRWLGSSDDEHSRIVLPPETREQPSLVRLE